MRSVRCQTCSKEFSVIPARLATARFCSVACRAEWRSKNWRGSAHPRWTGGDRKKLCQFCGCEFSHKPSSPITTFRRQKFCSKACADKGGIRHRGADNALYRPTARRRNRGGGHKAWAVAVISRDNATCQRCGVSGVELHAHHIKPYQDFPELRWDISNGLTLCYRCHWAVHHPASSAKAVNSVDTLPGHAGGNTEPSSERKFVEGVTTRGRAYRRWFGQCANCAAPISKPQSDIVGRANLFCSKRCAGRFNALHGKTLPRRGNNASTSAAPERDDIV